MADNIQLDEGSSGKYTETEEQGTGIHRQAIKVSGVGACALKKLKTMSQQLQLVTANTDYVVTNALAVGTKYVTIYSASPFIAAMGEATSATVGVGCSAGSVTFPVVRTGVTADDKVHVQSPVVGAIVRVTEMAD